MKKLNKLWPAFLLPVIIIVIADLLIKWLTDFNILGEIWRGVKGFFSLFLINITLPLWLMILLMLAIPFLYIVIMLSYRISTEDSIEKYTSDTIFGIIWKWQYSRFQSIEETLVARCPECRTLLKAREEYSARSPMHDGIIDKVAILTCDNCGFEKSFEFDLKNLRQRVALEIDRKLETGDYKTVIQNQ